MQRPLYLVAGLAALGLGAVGVAVPGLPTVPFLLLAAFCFARGNPEWEQRLLAHPRWGPPIRDWRERGAISRRGKGAALVTLAFSAALAWWSMSWPLLLLPVGAAAAAGAWIATRPA